MPPRGNEPSGISSKEPPQAPSWIRARAQTRCVCVSVRMRVCMIMRMRGVRSSPWTPPPTRGQQGKGCAGRGFSPAPPTFQPSRDSSQHPMEQILQPRTIGESFFFFFKVGERESDCKNGQGFKEDLLKDPGATYGKQRVYFHLTASVEDFF